MQDSARLSSRLFDLSAEKQSLLVVCLVDGSGSINRADFDGPMKEGLKFLNSCLTTASKALIQFSNGSQHECAPTTSIPTFDQAVNKMRQISQGTNTKHGMATALSLCKVAPEGQKIILLLTDGCPNKGCEPTAEVAEARDLGVEVFALGVGRGVEEKALQELCTGGMYFHLSDYRAFVREVKQAQDANSAKAAQMVVVDFAPARKEMRSNRPLQLTIVVKNNSGTATIPPRQKIVFEKNAYFEPAEYVLQEAVPPHATTTGTITLTPCSSARESDFPGQVEFIFQQGRVTQRGAITLGTGFLRGDYRARTPINFFLYGPRGSGKSSLLNAIVTCLTLEKEPSRIFVAMNKPDHVTTFYGKSVLSKVVHESDIAVEDQFNDNDDGWKNDGGKDDEFQLVAFDTWGTSDDGEYDSVTIESFLQGRVAPGAQMNNVIKYLRPAEKGDEIHVVVYVTKLTASMDGGSLEGIAESMKSISSLGYTPLLVVTRIDDVEDAEENARLRKEILDAMPITPASVFFHKNYVNEEEREIKVDLSTRKILRAICKSYQDRCITLGRGYFHDVQWDLRSVMQPVHWDNLAPQSSPTKAKTDSKPPQSQGARGSPARAPPQLKTSTPPRKQEPKPQARTPHANQPAGGASDDEEEESEVLVDVEFNGCTKTYCLDASKTYDDLLRLMDRRFKSMNLLDGYEFVEHRGSKTICIDGGSQVKAGLVSLEPM